MTPLVVLGCSNEMQLEVDEAACVQDQIPVLKRYGGGGTVLLYPGSVVASIGTWVAQPFENSRYFQVLNQAIIDLLASRFSNLTGLTQQGISDITWKDRKVVGTSLFRSRNYLLYQASILCDLDIALIQRYLKHPSREPDYRAGRPHGDFLVGLTSIDAEARASTVALHLKESLHSAVASGLGAELLSPQPDQFRNLDARVLRSRATSGNLPPGLT